MEQQKMLLQKLHLKFFFTVNRNSSLSKRNSSSFKQRGAILVISVILLMIMTLIGVGIFEGSFTESKMESNANIIAQANFANQVAMQAATNVVNSWTQNPSTCNSSPCCGGCVWQQGALQPSPNWYQSANVYVNNVSTAAATWWQGGSNNGITTLSGVPNVAQQPQYTIEQWGCDASTATRYFRVVTQSVGSTNPPSVINTKIIASTKALPAPQVMFNISYNMTSSGYTWVQYSFSPYFSGVITDLYFGEGCWSQGMNATVTLHSTTGGTWTNTMNFSAACCCVGTGPTCNMGHASMPAGVNYKVLASDVLTVTVQDHSGCGFHTNSTGVGPFRMTIMGIPSFCP